MAGAHTLECIVPLATGWHAALYNLYNLHACLLDCRCACLIACVLACMLVSMIDYTMFALLYKSCYSNAKFIFEGVGYGL